MSPGWHGEHAQSWDRTRASIFDLWPRMYRIEVLAHADSLTSTSRIHLTDKAQRYFNRPGWGHNPSVSRTTSRSFWTALCTRFEILWLVLPSSGRSGASHQACHNVSKTSQDREIFEKYDFYWFNHCYIFSLMRAILLQFNLFCLGNQNKKKLDFRQWLSKGLSVQKWAIDMLGKRMLSNSNYIKGNGWITARFWEACWLTRDNQRRSESWGEKGNPWYIQYNWTRWDN